MTTPTVKRLDKALFGFFVLFVFASTFSIALAQTALGVAVALFLALIFLTRYNPFAAGLRRFYIAVGLYVGWLVFTSVIGPTPHDSLWDIKKEWLFLAVPVGVYLFAYEKHRSRIITILAVGVVLVSIYGIIQHFTGTHWFKHSRPLGSAGGGYRSEGNFSIPMSFGNYFSTVALFLLGYAVAAGRPALRKRYYLVMSAAVLGMLAATASLVRGAAVAMVVALVALGFIRGRRAFVYILGTLALVVVLAAVISPALRTRFGEQLGTEIKGEYEGSRIFIWENSLKIIRDHPLFGVGLGNFKSAYTSYLRKDIPDSRKHAHAHNDFFNAAAVSGVPGAVILAALWAVVLGCLWKGWQDNRGDPQVGPYLLAALLGSLTFLVTSFTEATFLDEEVRQLLMFVWAVGLWPLYKNRRSTTTTPAAHRAPDATERT